MTEPETTYVLLAAVQDELAPTINRLKLTAASGEYGGRVGSTNVIARITGVGATRAGMALDELIDRHKPQRVIHTGFAGALDPDLGPGDIINVGFVTDESGQVISLVGDSTERSPRQTVLTLGRIADTVQVKRQLFETHRAAAVDMETFHVARACAEQGIAYTAVRAISDTADMALPAQAIEWVKPDGTPDMAKAMSFVATRPWLMPSMMKLQSHAKMAASRLADRLEQMIGDA